MTSEPKIVRVKTIYVRLEDYDWRFAAEESSRINAHWKRLREEKPALFDGRVLLSHRLAIEEGRLSGACFETGYKSFLAWRDFGYPGAGITNLFAMPALRAADGAFMLGEMNATTANAGRLYFPAGTPEPADVNTQGLVDFDANILRELAEETGLSPRDVTLDADWVLVFAEPLVACMKVARSALDAAPLLARFAEFNALQTNPELARLVPVYGPDHYDAKSMPDFMLRYMAYALATPQAR